MNKIFAVSVLMVTSISAASALTQAVPANGMMRTTASEKVQEERGENKGKVVMGAVQAMPQGRVMPTTGDPVIDAQLKTLTLDMEAKVKVITDDYQKKVKALIGNKTLKMPPSAAPGTPMRPQAGAQANASGTVPVRTVGMMRPNTTVKPGVENDQTQNGIGSKLNAFFRGIIGGDN